MFRRNDDTIGITIADADKGYVGILRAQQPRRFFVMDAQGAEVLSISREDGWGASMRLVGTCAVRDAAGLIGRIVQPQGLIELIRKSPTAQILGVTGSPLGQLRWSTVTVGRGQDDYDTHLAGAAVLDRDGNEVATLTVERVENTAGWLKRAGLYWLGRSPSPVRTDEYRLVLRRDVNGPLRILSFAGFAVLVGYGPYLNDVS